MLGALRTVTFLTMVPLAVSAASPEGSSALRGSLRSFELDVLTPTTRTSHQQDDYASGRLLQDGTCLCETNDNDGNPAETVKTVRMLGPGGNNDKISARFRSRAAAFYEKTGIQVEIVPVGNDINGEILADTRAKVYDGYVFLPSITGQVVAQDGLADLSDFVVSNQDVVWTDIFPFNRDLQAIYDNEVRTIPCDGDVYSMFYRQDLFDYYNKTVPRTWDEYAETAAFFDGMEVPAGDLRDPATWLESNNSTVTLSGSCVDRTKGCNWQYHLSVLVHAATTQALGTLSSPFFDPQTFQPLMGEGMAETLRHMENQVMFGDDHELDATEQWACLDINFKMLQGTCAMTYYWGDIFNLHLNEERSVLKQGQLGVAPTPGVTKVLDRTTGQLVQCNEQTCPHGKDYPDIGRVNYAPFAAAGGWSGGVSNGVSSARQQAMADFIGFVCGKEESIEDVIPYANGGKQTGADPYRSSHHDIEKWVERGYERDVAKQFLETITEQLSSPNAVLDARFPGAAEMLGGMYDVIYEHLVEAQTREPTHQDRLATAAKIEALWIEKTIKYDEERPLDSLPIKALYQKDYNAYIPPAVEQSDGLSIGIIVGIVIGCSIFIGLVIGAIILFFSLRHIKEQKKMAEQEAKKRAERAALREENDDISESVDEPSRDEIEEILKLTSKQTRRVNVGRWLFLSAFLAIAISFTVITYRLVEEGQADNINLSPEQTAGLVGGLLAFVGILFMVYDRFVHQKSEMIIANAARANAVVTNLFPGQFRDQIMDENNEENKSNKISVFGTKSKMKDFLANGGEDTQSKQPLADLYLDTTILFADISGFTAWASVREPSQVFALLENVYGHFDDLANRRRVFKVETVGDCYVAATGIPDPRNDHAILMARFAKDIMHSFGSLVRNLEVKLGPDTGDLRLRIGIHSGPVTAGILRGDRARFQLFGDTMNVASRMENTGIQGKIQVSPETAETLKLGGKGHWIEPRKDLVDAKGKGLIQTFWLNVKSAGLQSDGGTSSGDSDSAGHDPENSYREQKKRRLIEWNTEMLLGLIKQIVARRQTVNQAKSKSFRFGSSVDTRRIKEGETALDEVKEIIELPEFDSATDAGEVDPATIEIDSVVVDQLRYYVTCIANMYKDNPFHNFEHASHVSMSAIKLLNRITAPSDIDAWMSADMNGGLTKGGMEQSRLATCLHDHTYGITSDPMTQFACAFSALIHDVDHQGIPNTQLVKEQYSIATLYKNRSVAEQNSLDLAWELLLDERFTDLRNTLCVTENEFRHFRQLVVNSVMATDIVDKDLKTLRNNKWDKAFKPEKVNAKEESQKDAINRKATIVIEHLIQASDVSHTMQHWNVYRKWNERLFEELYKAYRLGRADKSPEEFWAKGEIGFFDFYIIPLASKLKDCGVFGVSSGEFLNYAMQNRNEWEEKGERIVAEMMEKFSKK